jgi:hypothetical protein
MLEMNYGCGSTVHPRDLAGSPTVLYVGVGGGMELLTTSRCPEIWNVVPGRRFVASGQRVSAAV